LDLVVIPGNFLNKLSNSIRGVSFANHFLIKDSGVKKSEILIGWFINLEEISKKEGENNNTGRSKLM